jgi:hypothetical protein
VRALFTQAARFQSWLDESSKMRRKLRADYETNPSRTGMAGDRSFAPLVFSTNWWIKWIQRGAG